MKIKETPLDSRMKNIQTVIFFVANKFSQRKKNVKLVFVLFVYLLDKSACGNVVL